MISSSFEAEGKGAQLESEESELQELEGQQAKLSKDQTDLVAARDVILSDLKNQESAKSNIQDHLDLRRNRQRVIDLQSKVQEAKVKLQGWVEF